MLDKAVAAVKKDKAKALDMFNKGEGGFKDRDLYVWCANASDGMMTAHPWLKGKHMQEILGKKGKPFGQEIMEKATMAKSLCRMVVVYLTSRRCKQHFALRPHT